MLPPLSLPSDPALELVTPPLDGIILPGVVRQSLLDLARTWVRACCLRVARVTGYCCVAGLEYWGWWRGRGAVACLFLTIHTAGSEVICLAPQGEFRVTERKITMKEFLRALEDGRVREVFGSGTACQVCPVHQILYQGKVRKGQLGP